jgi:aspartate/methionine/tyrosine aminotransferase
VKAPAVRATGLRRSEIRVLFDAAAQRPEVLRLEVGEPSFTTPVHIIDAAAAAAHDGHTGYGPNGGLTTLRELLAEKVRRVDGITAHPDQIVVTPGGMNALFSTYLALLEPGDEVLLPTPGFPNMDEMVRLVGGGAVFYHLDGSNGFLPDIERLEGLVSARTKVLFINTPANPTGAVFAKSLMEDLVDFAARHDLWLLSDEVYDEMVLDPTRSHTAAAPMDGDGRVITVFSFSKVYAMTGWRVGYAVAPPDIAQLLRTLQEPEVSCPSTISQKAAEAALTGPREPIDAMLGAYRRRRAVALETASSCGLRVVPPDGTLYMLVDVSKAPRTGLDFAMDLLHRFDVSVAPGSVFGPAGEGWVRISLAADDGVIDEGLRRIAAATQEASR